jgi:CO dehydrogenase maturation factor
MSRTIVVTGKGGVGKTALAALVIKALSEARAGTILAVDADPNLNLDRALGVVAQETVGSVREETLERAATLSGGMSKAEYLQYRTQESLVETERYDLIAMGRPEGPGCYCYANSVLRQVVDKLAAHYDYVVVDCEAGLEHLSRRTAGRADFLLVVTDSSVRSAQTVRRVVELTEELRSQVGKVLVLVNRCRNGSPEAVRAILQECGLQPATEIPEDESIRALDDVGGALTDVPADSPAYRAVKELIRDSGIAQLG